MAQTVYDPPVATYIPLQTITLGSSASSVTFASIPQTYRDLIIVMDAKASVTAGARMVANSDTGTNYSYVRMYGTGSGSGSGDTGSTAFAYIGDVFTTNTPIIIQIMDYSATDKHKISLWRMNSAQNYVMAGATRWASNTAISSLAFSLDSARTYETGTTISLYGIEA
jgi:hypothetical protein